MKHLTNIQDIEQTIADNRFCLFYIKAPDCGVCNVMLDKVERLTASFPALCSFYTDITSIKREQSPLDLWSLVPKGSQETRLSYAEREHLRSRFISTAKVQQSPETALTQLSGDFTKSGESFY